MRPFVFLLCVVALAVLGYPAPASPVLGASDSLSLPQVGDIGTVFLNLTGAETGLSGYNISLNVFPSGTAEIMSVTFPSWASMPLNGTMPAENTWIKAIDLDMEAEPGASSVPIAFITIRATTEGETILTVVPSIVDDDLGGRYGLDPINVPVSVGAVGKESDHSDVPSMNIEVSSSSSAVVPSPESPKWSETPISPNGTLIPEIESDSASLSTQSSDMSASGQAVQPTNPTPGFDCTTFCLAGLLICALILHMKGSDD